MIKFIGLLSAMLLSATVFPQDSVKVDSLLKLIDVQPQDSNSLSALEQLGSDYAYNNSIKAIEYLGKAVDLAKKLQHPLGLANAYFSLGFCYLVKGDLDKAFEFYQKSADLYEKLNDQRRLANTYMAIGTVFTRNNDFKKSTDYYDKAEAIVQQTKDTMQLSTIYSEKGIRYDMVGKWDSALIFFNKSMMLAKAIHDNYMVNELLSNIGLSYKHKKNNTLALQYFDSSLQFNEQYNDKNLMIFSTLYNNIGATWSQAGNFEKAQLAFYKSIDYAKQANMVSIEIENYKNLADMFGVMNNYKQQVNYLEKYHHLKDSIFTTDNTNQLTQLEADYQIEKKNASIIAEQANAARSKVERNISLVIGAAVLLVLILLFFFYEKMKRSSKKIEEQKLELENLNAVKDRLFSIISHDLRNPMVALNTYLSLADNPATSAEKKLRYKNQTQQAINNTSSLLDNLLAWANMQVRKTAPAISFIDLNECIDDALNAVQAQAEQKEITFVKNMDVASASADVHIIEIALRNLISNAIKFSPNGSNIEISTYVMDNRPCIEVRDEGMGMTPTQLNNLLQNHADSHVGTKGEKGSGLGIFLVKALLDQIKATLQIESIEGAGSKFIIKL
jgi:signal transduction histidine kinase